MAIDFNGTPGEYTYSQGQYGKSAEGIVSVGAQSDRNPSAQQQAGGADREAGDHGGHLIPHSLGGRNDESNLDAQAANVNQIDQRGAERNAASLAQDENNTVYMGVTNYTRDGSERPDATMITLGVMNNQTGSIDVETMSYTNANHAEHESWNDTALRNEGVDSRQDVGMTAEQRALANDLVGAEDAIDSRVGSGWTTTHFENNEYLYSISSTNLSKTSLTLVGSVIIGVSKCGISA